MRMNIGKKLISGFLGVALLVFLSGILGIFSVNKVGKSTDVILEEEMPLADASMEMKIALITSRDLTGEYLSKEKVEELPQVEKEFDSAFDGYTGWVKKIEAMELSSEEKGIIESLDKKDDTYIADAKSMMGNHRKSREYYDESKAQMVQFDNARNEVMDDLVKLEEAQDKEFGDVAIRADKMAESPDSTKTQIMELLDEVLDTHVKAADAGMEMKTSVVLQGDGCGEYLLEDDPSKLPEIEKGIRSSIDEFDKWEGALEKIDVGADVKKFMEEIVGDHNELEKTQDKMLLAHRNYIECKVMARVDMGKLDSISASMEEDLTKLEELSGQGMNKAMVTADRTQNTSSILLIALTVIAVILAIVIGIVISRGITRPIRTVMDISNRIVVEGDLSKMVDVKGMKIAEEEEEEAKTKDETVLLAISFNRLIRSMRKLAAQANAIAADDLMNKILEEKIKGDLGSAFTVMIVNLRGLADQAQAIANDDLGNPILTKVGKGTLGSATSKMVENLKGLSKQAESISNDELDNPILKEEAKGVLGSSFARMVFFLRGIAQKANIIAKGDLTPTIETKGTLSDAFNLMITSLKELVKRLKGSSNQIASASNQILTASEQQATGIEEEASQISQTATSAKQLATTSKQVADLSNEISKSSISSVQMANSGTQAVDNAIAGMEKIKSSVLETSKKIEGLSEKGQAINEVVTLIDDIANQTNLLSLNASIEAARAGEAGKGFAVVADAIGKLADRTTKSTKDISDLIKGIQQDTSGCVMSMEESTKETEKGSSLAQEAGKAIKELVSSFEHVAQSAKEILLASQQQTSGATQISKGMMGIDDIMKQSAAGAKQSTESARELVTLADEFKKIIGGGKLGEKEEEKI